MQAAGARVDAQILGVGGVPSSSAEVLAVAVSITVTSPTQPGYLSAFPSGSSAGISSVVNFVAGQTVPNLTIATVGANGKLTIQLSAAVRHRTCLRRCLRVVLHECLIHDLAPG